MTALSKVIENDQMQSILKEFSRLGDRCYLENAGANLYPQSLLTSIHEDLMKNIYMNPHTDNYTKECIEQIRTIVLKHFNTDSNNYSLVFTSGTTEALKLTVESFEFAVSSENDDDNGTFIYLRDNHTSVLGLREIAAEKNADVVHISHDEFLNCLKASPQSTLDKKKNKGNALFAYPAQSNFNGYKYPLNCIDKIKYGCLNKCLRMNLCKEKTFWYTLLDVASYVPTNKLDLSEIEPDFVCLSFYKIFGYPTGLGALLIKNSSAKVLTDKKYFGGGTVDIVLSGENFHIRRETLHERFEDGTVPFLSIIALKHCFDTMRNLIPKIINNDIMETISHHTFHLAQDLHKQLKELIHKNGKAAVILYMDSDFTDIKKQGAIVTFNIVREDETFIGYAEFQHMADLFNIDVRTGCFCNSGACQRHLDHTNKAMKDTYNAGHKCGDNIDLVNGLPTGAIRASFAYYNTFNDVDKLVAMICRCFVKMKFVRPERDTLTFKKIAEVKPNSAVTYAEKFKTLVPFIPKSTTRAVLKEIAIYPIKSCGAFKINSAWFIGPKGFEFDREWMIIKDNGLCLTQKQNSRMCMIQPKIDLKHNVMILNFKDKDPITVLLDIPNDYKMSASLCQSRVCTDTISGYDCGDDVANWISEALEISCLRLIRQADSDDRKQKKRKDNEDRKMLSLSNQAQFLLVNKATVKWLKEKIADKAFIDSVEELTDRFRANLVIDADDVLVEREWKKIIIGKHMFRVEGQCSRCQMVCIDQKTGKKTVEPLRTIAEQFAGKLRFGIYLSYLGPLNNMHDPLLEVNVPVRSIVSDEEISR